MTLDPEHLAYPHRRYGMDHDRYDWDPPCRRARATLASGAKALAVLVVPLEFFPLNPPAGPFKHPGAMATPYPDLRHYTCRDYGARVGVFRILRALAAAGLNATFAVNALVAQRYPPLLAAIAAAGHEIAAHGVSTAHLHHAGLSEAEEAALVATTRAALPWARVWLSPARNQSFLTPDLAREAGFEICLDWEFDERPTPMRTRAGPLWCVPLHNELSDFTLLSTRSQTEDAWAEQVLEAAAYGVARAEAEGALSLGITLTPYVAGQAFRQQALSRILHGLAAQPGLEAATVSAAAAAFATG